MAAPLSCHQELCSASEHQQESRILHQLIQVRACSQFLHHFLEQSVILAEALTVLASPEGCSDQLSNLADILQIKHALLRSCLATGFQSNAHFLHQHMANAQAAFCSCQVKIQIGSLVLCSFLSGRKAASDSSSIPLHQEHHRPHVMHHTYCFDYKVLTHGLC